MIDQLFSLLWQWRYKTKPSELVQSKLYDEESFYKQFICDLKQAKMEVIIESPFISSQRMYSLKPLFESLVARKIKVYILTRDPHDHDTSMMHQAEAAIRSFEMLGVQVLINAIYSHRKLAIIDRHVLWEGSLNILSQTYSREIMRRIDSQTQAEACFKFIHLGKYIY